ncbi:Putative Zinc finger, MIZ-type, Zinc finger, RING/FYVE/PHD-type [Septoria linicola]|uniref:Zinc finger, MIZ-type, Zinc finger, RING/FYVE/PHD-type n=1 Tax=Septoria linicola TaxID=215465 RepID=A0A9Q9ANZ2_9PEZI|nr:putative Zinc finger, MIZ-type, Zinc finger, RING/FYVE/PHD-type [Septoria linicola]USW49573.1 Putative Zinc finger, MIZ-type, Zinc finger, RING/FYVE/PHD-type [Septoria linicola]
MAVSGEPPPKRTRTDVIAQSNAHLQYLHGRQDRWMTAATGNVEDSSLRDPPAASRAPLPTATRTDETPNASTRTTNPLSTASPLVIDLDEEDEASEERSQDAPAQHTSEARATQQETRQASRATSQPRMQPHSAPHLVQYELPPTMVDAATGLPTPRVAARKSMDRTSRAAPSLPSPAPSDETTNSPTFAENHITAMRRPVHPQRVFTDLGLNNRTPASGSPLVMQSPGFPPQHVRHISIPQNAHVLQAVPSSDQSGQSFQFMQQPTHALHNPQWQNSAQGQHQRRSTQSSVQAPLSLAPVVQSNAQPLQTPAIVPSNHGHPYPPPPVQNRTPAASRINKDILLDRITEKQQELQHISTDYDNGRLALLRTAVEREDWFYQVLSQVFCLKSVMPSLLPKSLKALPISSWEHVANLLCSNTEINNDLLGFFADFPEPIMDLYSDQSNARDIYEYRAGMVKTFLIALPQCWDSLTLTSRQMLAPPLVEDMATFLHLHSPVLQTTCFRAIMRLFWGVEDSSGAEALMVLHQVDQHTFFANGWRRTQQEKLEAYAALRRAYDAWGQYQHSQRQLLSGNFRGTLGPFVIPNDVQQLFRTIPRSTHHRIQQHQQSQAQPTNQHIAQQRWQPPQAMQQSRISNTTALQSPTILSPGSLPHLRPAGPRRQVSGSLTSASPQIPQPGATSRQPKKGNLFPTLDQCPRAQPTHPDSNRSGLQQAHLRSPVLASANVGTLGPKLYRHIVGFALAPATIKKRLAVQQAVFNITGDDFGKLARTVSAPAGTGTRPTRVIKEESLMYRVRCCAVPATGFISESSWIVADTSWPEELCFELNGTPLFTRRKLHHGKYLPIDVTSHVLLGTNNFKILLNRHTNDKRKFDFAVAVETIGVVSHDTIKQSLKRVTAKDSLLAIKKALTGGDDMGDDDITVTSSNMTVGIVEPLSQARMVDLPVRGVNCLHKDVFDLEVFLSVCKREQPNWPSIVDCWRCPLCRGDVRPPTLVVDEFLVDVRAELEKKNLLDTKAIIIEADGTWKPKVEQRTGVRSPSLEREERASAAAPVARPVIELD